jgi:muconate cycloisomerase
MLKAALMGNTGAHSAVEMALFDLAGQAAGLPVIDFIGGPARSRVGPMWLLGNATAEDDIAEAREREQAGFHFFKLKIGVKPLAAEIASTLAVRDALGPDVPLCADANCGLTLAAARHYAEAVRAANLMFLEQPLGHDDRDGFAALARTAALPIGVDEGIHGAADIEAHARCGAGGVSLKLIKLGGLAPAMQAALLCQRLGLSVNIAAKIAESSIASAAAVHLACAVPSVDWGVSLTHFYLAEDLVRAPLAVSDDGVALPLAPGLGIAVDEDAVGRFQIKP